MKKLEEWTDEAISTEINNQRKVLRENPQWSQRWIQANRIAAHLESERERRRRRAAQAEEQRA